MSDDLDMTTPESEPWDPRREKERATAEGRPWVGPVASGFDPTKTPEFWIELDWNDKFIEYLRREGYTGESPEQLVEEWYQTAMLKAVLVTLPPEISTNLYRMMRRHGGLDPLVIDRYRGGGEDRNRLFFS